MIFGPEKNKTFYFRIKQRQNDGCIEKGELNLKIDECDKYEQNI